MDKLRQAAAAALEALENFARFQRMMMDGPDASDKLLAEDYAEAGFLQGAQAIPALKAALAEPVQEPESPARRCGGPGCDMKCCQPVQEPVAWLFTNLQSGDYDFCYQEDEHDHDREMWHKQPLYTAPPQRKPLTEEEIGRVTAQARDELLDHIYEYGTAAEGVLERIRKLCRAVERAYGIKENPDE